MTYVWHILDSLFVSTAYQRRTCGASRVSMAAMCYVCATFVSLLWSMCDVLGVNRNILWRSKRILMLLYKCFRFFEVMDQMFLMVRGAVQVLSGLRSV